MAIFDDILNDIRVELIEEFDTNFSNGGFFGKKWQPKADGEPSMLQKSRTMRGTNNARVVGQEIIFTNATPYANIHNEGGTFISTPTVTRKMQRFAWAKYYKAGGKKGGEKANKWRALALKPIGTKLSITINMPQRQFIGDHPQVQQSIQQVLNEHITGQFKAVIESVNKKNNNQQ